MFAPSIPALTSDGPADGATALTVEAAAEVHARLGPGLPREAYAAALGHELVARGVAFQRELRLPVFYRGVRLSAVYRIELCVAGLVAVEVLSDAGISAVVRAEMRGKLRASGLEAGVIVNFGAVRLGQGLVVLRRKERRARTAEKLELLERETPAPVELADEDCESVD